MTDTEPAGSIAMVSGLADFYAGSYTRVIRVVSLAAADRGDAEEAVQEAFTRLVPRWGDVCRYDDPEAWVRKVAFRQLSKRRRTVLTARRLLPLVSRPEAQPPSDPDHLDVRRALLALPTPQRQVIVLHYFQDLGLQQIAEELDVALGTVKSRLHRGRSTLLSLLELTEEWHD